MDLIENFIIYDFNSFVLDSTRVSLESMIPELEASIIKYALTEPLKLVKQVSDIPRMYR